MMSRFLRRPATVRNAVGVIVTSSALVVLIAGVAMRLLDSRDFPDLGLAMWWSVQTVTTVGYGDVTPKETVGRVVAALLMLEGVALISVVTAAITSAFVTRARRERSGTDEDERRHEELVARLDRLEDLLRERAPSS
jgi:voltage-gated potassium channel